MTTFFSAVIDMTSVASQIDTEHAYNEFFNEIGYVTQDDVRQEEFAKHIGEDLEDHGKSFLVELAKFTMAQFPEEFEAMRKEEE